MFEARVFLQVCVSEHLLYLYLSLHAHVSTRLSLNKRLRKFGLSRASPLVSQPN